ncbi:hypothetical protein CY658_03125 [Variovorax sp. RO1]|nr:hypothetical protein CY658_03125 [Variovorax sp. RO1]
MEPSRTNRIKLEKSEPVRYSEYRKRREILIVNRGHHSLLDPIEHLRAGDREGEKYIDLSQVLDFARQQDWSIVEAFIQGMEGKHIETSALGAGIQDIDEDEFDMHELKKGDRYLMVRMGAILILLEKCLRSGKEVNPHRYLKKDDLNYLALGKEIEKIITDVAKKKDARFGFEGNRSVFSDAVKALNTFFSTAKR